jgi:hypothetical protein
VRAREQDVEGPLASFVAVERPRKAKIRPTNGPVSLSVWEPDCHTLRAMMLQVSLSLDLSMGT